MKLCKIMSSDSEYLEKPECAWLFSPRYCELSSKLPRNAERARLVESLIDAVGIPGSHLSRQEVEPASERDISAFHTRDFVKALKQPKRVSAEDLEEYGLVDDCPAFDGVLELACLEAGGTLQAANLCKNI